MNPEFISFILYKILPYAIPVFLLLCWPMAIIEGNKVHLSINYIKISTIVFVSLVLLYVTSFFVALGIHNGWFAISLWIPLYANIVLTGLITIETSSKTIYHIANKSGRISIFINAVCAVVYGMSFVTFLFYTT